MLILGGVVGVAGGFLTDQYINTFALPPEDEVSQSDPESEEFKAAQLVVQEQVESKNIALVLGLIGVLLGSLLGLSIGWIRHSGKVAVAGFLLGAVLGGGFGALGGFTSVKAWYRVPKETWTQVETRLEGADVVTVKAGASQAAGWMILGTGLALTGGLLSPPRGKSFGKLLLTLIGAGLAAGFLTPFLSAFLTTIALTDLPVPAETTPRILWASLASVLLLVAAGRTANTIAKTAATPAPEEPEKTA